MNTKSQRPTNEQLVEQAIQSASGPAGAAAKNALLQRLSDYETRLQQHAAEPFQARVEPWMIACFGEEIANDRNERNYRFLEESLELVQACECTVEDAHALVDYVFNRPPGEPILEAGGVMITLAALCRAHDIYMHDAGDSELKRVWKIKDKIRAKHLTKPIKSPHPVTPGS